MKPKIAGIALGSNLGNRHAFIQSAIDQLRAIHHGNDDTFLVATPIETEPINCAPGTPPFLNTVLQLHTTLAPLDLLDFCQQLERDAGRADIREKNSPRTLDIDLLYLGDVEMKTDRLTLPHPLMKTRDFVMIPLREIRPDFSSP